SDLGDAESRVVNLLRANAFSWERVDLPRQDVARAPEAQAMLGVSGGGAGGEEAMIPPLTQAAGPGGVAPGNGPGDAAIEAPPAEEARKDKTEVASSRDDRDSLKSSVRPG